MRKGEILREYCDGMSVQQIAKAHGVTVEEVKRICNAHWDTNFNAWDPTSDRPSSVLAGNVVGMD